MKSKARKALDFELKLRLFIRRAGIVAYLGSMAAAWYVYGWELSLILLVFSWGIGVHNEHTYKKF